MDVRYWTFTTVYWREHENVGSFFNNRATILYVDEIAWFHRYNKKNSSAVMSDMSKAKQSVMWWYFGL